MADTPRSVARKRVVDVDSRALMGPCAAGNVMVVTVHFAALASAMEEQAAVCSAWIVRSPVVVPTAR